MGWAISLIAAEKRSKDGRERKRLEISAATEGLGREKQERKEEGGKRMEIFRVREEKKGGSNSEEFSIGAGGV